MTEAICRDIGIVAFAAFAAYGIIGTLKLVRSKAVPPGPRPWALCGLFVMLEAVQLYGLIAPRPGAEIQAGAIVALAALFFCGYLQWLYLASVSAGAATFPRKPFYIGIVVLLAIVLAAHAAAAYLP